METQSNPLPFVSVIVPVFNMGNFIAETLQSILTTSYPNYEIIVIDDGSTDNSLEIVKSYADQHPQIRIISQPNQGVSAARNNGIREAKGEYILPVDGDDLITSEFIGSAISVIHGNPHIQLVSPSAEFIGERKGLWNLKPFSLKLLARKNMINACGLYRRKDWKIAGGYPEGIGREDWAFWIALLKNGGDVVRLPEIGMFYRIHSSSKRKRDRLLLKETIDELNRRHPEFFFRELGGPLRYRRSLSRVINAFSNFFHHTKWTVNTDFKSLDGFVLALPKKFKKEGTVIYKGRNELREYQVNGYDLVVKSYKLPNLPNRIIYGLFRPSKAERAYFYGLNLRSKGFDTPQPIGFITRRRWFLFRDSYSVSFKSSCPYTYKDLRYPFPHKEEILKAIAHFTARLHENKILHKDYSQGNILFDRSDKGVKIEIIDLNRIIFRKVTLEKGCKNFERLPGDDNTLEILGKTYAEERHFSPEICVSKIKKYVALELEKREKQKK